MCSAPLSGDHFFIEPYYIVINLPDKQISKDIAYLDVKGKGRRIHQNCKTESLIMCSSF